MPVIEVTVSPLGDTRIETHGFGGVACQSATRSLEAALGLVQTETFTPEFYDTSTAETPLVARPAAGL